MSQRAAIAYPFTGSRVMVLGWGIFRAAWRAILGSVTVALLPAYVLRFVVDVAFGDRIFEWFDEARRATELNLPQPPRPADFDAAFAANAAATVVLFVSSLVATGAVVVIVDHVYRGESAPARGALAEAARRLAALVAGQLLVFLAILVAAMLGLMLAGTFLLGGGILVFFGLVVLVAALAAVLFVIVRSNVTSVAVMVERIGGSDGFRRSWGLVADHGWRMLGYVVVIGLLGLLVTFAVGFIHTVFDPVGPNSVADTAYSTIVAAAAAIIAGPIAPLALTLLYYDLRWRHGETVPAPGGPETPDRPPDKGA